jgi:acylphosphatase
VVRLRAVVHGDVQGVGFRYHLFDAARPLGVRGWVRNRPDGSVELVAEGERDQLDRVLEAARQGPLGAIVTGVEVEWGDARGDLTPFRVEH